jgi:hypothetical protein
VLPWALVVSAPAHAAVPASLTQQGRLFDPAGAPLNGTVTVRFSVYASASGGAALWTETQALALDEGYFSAQLGATTPFPASLWDGATRWVGTQVGTDAEMTPRQATTSVPYALVAGDAVGDLHPTTITVNGVLVVDATGNWVGPSTGLVGPQGPQGVAGAQGPQGTPGATGVAGATGPQGAAGATGVAGATGPQGTAGATGAAGATGVAGATGPQGAAGATGIAGATGPQGAVGATGIAGATGPQGVAGATGVAGPAGAVGPQGPVGSTGAVGATGPQGPQGIAGATGPAGAVGPTGPGGQWTTSGTSIYYAGGNVGVGTSTPATTLDVNGTLRLAKWSAAPFTCDATHDGAIALSSLYATCVCKSGTGWITTATQAACVWSSGGCAGSVAITAGATSTNLVSNALAIVLSKPSGVVSGNVLVADITTNNSLAATPPSGWTAIQTSNGGGNCGSTSFYHVAGASEPASYSFGFSSGTYASGLVTSFLNVDNANPVDASSLTIASGSVYTATGVTTSTSSEMLVLLLSSGNGAETWTGPSGWTAGYTGGENSTSTGVFYKLAAAAGATGAFSATPTIVDTGKAHLVALKAACP